jgi:integrase
MKKKKKALPTIWEIPDFRWMLSHTSFSCLSDITPKLWFAYVEMRLKSGIKPTSFNTTLRTLQSFLKFVRDFKYLICERTLELRPLKTAESLPRGLSHSQLNSILERANPFDYVWIILMAHSGLRTCEIRKLRWQDIDLKHCTIRIEQSKGLRSRLVFLSEPALEALKKLPKTNTYAFSYNNQPLSNRYCQSRLRTLGKKCNVQVTPHQLRHTCATMLLNAMQACQSLVCRQFWATNM